MKNTNSQSRVGWRPRPWWEAAGIGKTKTYEMIKAGIIRARKVGRATVIETSPDEFLASMPPITAKTS
jgi:hypothetical protein